MLTIQLQGRGRGADVALITRGGPIAAVRDGDAIVIDPRARTLTLEASDAEIARRMAGWRPPDPERLRPGSVHHKYVRLVSSAHHGCVA